jgi:WD40 repeat protein
LDLSADCRFALTGGKDRTAKLWDLRTGECVRTLGPHTDWVKSVCLLRPGRAACGCDDGSLVV